MSCLTSLPNDLLIHMYSYLDDPKDRASLVMTCKKLNEAFLKGVEQGKFGDHRIFVLKLRANERKKAGLQSSMSQLPSERLDDCLMTTGLVAVAITVISAVTLGCGACFGPTCMASSIKNSFLYIMYGSAGTGICFAGTAGIKGCCQKETMHERTRLLQTDREIDKERQNILEELKPKSLSMNDDFEDFIPY